MNARKILSGAVIWTLGILVPVSHHVLLMNAAVGEEGHSYSYHLMARYFFQLPWVLWVYLAAMAVVGLALIMDGLRGDRSATGR